MSRLKLLLNSTYARINTSVNFGTENTDTPRFLEAVHAILGSEIGTTSPDSKRVIGVDHLTGTVLEARVAIEACRG